MKKLMVGLIVLLTSFSVQSCTSGTYQVPDLIGLDVNQAKLMIAGEVKTEVTYEATNQYIPGVVIGFLDEIEVNDMIAKNKTLPLIVSKAPEDSFTHSQMIAYVHDLGFVTGPDSPNFDLLRASGAGSTDLGIPFVVDDQLVFLYGDTFSSTDSMTGIWKSNFIAISDDEDLSDGLTFSRVVANTNNIITAFAPGMHQRSVPDTESDDPTREVTKIPTGGIQIGDDVYLFYMSIRYWGSHGDWAVSYSQVVKTDPSFTQFEEVNGLQWTESEAPNFAQMYPFEVEEEPNYVYFISIPGGRFGGVSLSRVLKTNFEDKTQYEYYLGNDTWAQGDEALASFKQNPYYIIDGPCAEMSIMYNEYLQQWMVVYLKNSELVLQTASTLTGPWSDTETILTSFDFSGLYGGFIHPKMVDFDGQKFYFQLSRWLPIYQTQLIEVVLN